MILGYYEILRQLKAVPNLVQPQLLQNVNSNSIDLTLSDTYIEPVPRRDIIDTLRIHECFNTIHFNKTLTIVIPAHGYIIALTRERVEIPTHLCGIIVPRSSLVRIGLNIPATLIDSGFRGNIAIEIFNMNPVPVKLYAGQKVAQLLLIETKDAKPYCGQYQNQNMPTLPKKITFTDDTHVNKECENN